MYGNGSDGPLNVTSGTTNLNLDQKYQYTTVNVSSGAILSTANTVGSVLYILATTSINIAGSILLNSKLANGQSISSVTIDGTLYSNPSTGQGGAGGSNYAGATGGAGGMGYGGGGAGGGGITSSSVEYHGGNGGTGNTTGSGGAGISSSGGNFHGNNGTGYGGGGGSLVVDGSTGSTGQSGAGGGTPGANGANGSGSGALYYASGGGGAGGLAGKPGVHLVLKAPSITITGTINVSGSDAGSGGNGGNGAGNLPRGGSGGGGGGGGNSGNVYIEAQSLTDTTATYTLERGFASGGGTGYVFGTAGTPGTIGSVSKLLLAAPYPGPFVRVWDGTSWAYSKILVKDTASFLEAKVSVE